jgi:hypothetical protein
MPEAISTKRVRRAIPRSRLPALSPQALTLLVCLAFTLLYNLRFWSAVLGAEPPATLTDWGRLAGYGVVMTALHFVVFLPLVNRVSVKPLLSLLLLVAASVSYFTGHYGAYFDTHMIDNVLQTDTREAGELLTPGLALYLLLYTVLPALLIWRWPLRQRSRLRGLGMSLLWLAGGIGVLVVSLLLSFQSLSSLMRNHHELRYLITPGNAIVSTGQVMAASEPLPEERLPIGEDARRQASATGTPRLLVMVVGETVRAADWGLSGYSRQTTPRLASRDVINFDEVTSCGTNTAVSLPCMFAPIGKSNYDERYIKSHESLLDVLQRAGFRVVWIDNQSGCKGVCDGVEQALFGFRALQREHGVVVGAVLDGRVEAPLVAVGDPAVVHLPVVARVRDEEKVRRPVVGEVVDDRVVEDGPRVVGDHRVLGLAGIEGGHVVGRESLHESLGVRAGHFDLAHVRDVEDPGRFADGRVFGADGVELDRHLPPAEVGECRPLVLVDPVQRRRPFRHTCIRPGQRPNSLVYLRSIAMTTVDSRSPYSSRTATATTGSRAGPTLIEFQDRYARYTYSR